MAYFQCLKKRQFEDLPWHSSSLLWSMLAWNLPGRGYHYTLQQLHFVRDQLPADRGTPPPLSTEENQLAFLGEGGRPVVPTTGRSVWKLILPCALGRIRYFLHRKERKERDCSVLRSMLVLLINDLILLAWLTQV